MERFCQKYCCNLPTQHFENCQILALSIWTYKKTWSSRCNFFQKCQKNYKCWIKCISKKFTTTGSANTCKPCPFGFGLRKFALDPVVVIFFKKCQKNYKCWIKWISKKFTTIGSANTCNFFWKWKKLISKKNTTMGF